MARACSTAPERCRVARGHWARPSPRQNTMGRKGGIWHKASGLARVAGPRDPGKFSAESEAHFDF